MPAGDPQLFDDEQYKQHIEPSGQRQLFSTSAYESSTPPQSPGIADKVHPGQFQMFMTPREIRTKYQALDADRQYAHDDRAGEPTGRAETTGGDPNDILYTERRNRLEGYYGKDRFAQATHTRSHEGHEESDDELFGRKLEESQLSPEEYRQVHGGTMPPPNPNVEEWNTLAQHTSAPSVVKRYAAGIKRQPGEGTWTAGEAEDEAYNYQDEKYQEAYDAHMEKHEWGPSLHDRIRSEGVQSPVHLSYDQLGSVGKPQIVGGHHRVAAAEDIDPDFPIPVQHWRNMNEARGSGKYD